MEETLGKRIVSNRKRVGLTQDKLAEALGITAQAVSKWENDQSCPDISMLPALASIFGISVDALLGLAEPKNETATDTEILEVTIPGAAEENPAAGKSHWEFRWDGGRKPRVWFAVWVLLMGALMLFNYINYGLATFWEMAWPSALMLFGLAGLYPKFSFFRLGCALLGTYTLLGNMHITNWFLNVQIIWIIAVFLFGLSLLVDALRKPKGSRFTIIQNGKHIGKSATSCDLGTDSFDTSVSFGDDSYRIDLPLLRRGEASVSFGECTVDLSGVEALAPDCRVEADCSFGELIIRIPRRFRAELTRSSSFGSIEVSGHPAADAQSVLHLDACASFGQISIVYI